MSRGVTLSKARLLEPTLKLMSIDPLAQATAASIAGKIAFGPSAGGF